VLGLDMRIVFMGSPDFAVPSLHTLAECFEIVGVITQPDRPSGRGRKLTHSSVKKLASELELPIFQPSTMKDIEAEQMLRDLSPDLVVVAAYGQILPENILQIPEYGILNVHASLLPRWRGASPIQASILHGDEDTGISLMLIDPGMDSGPILSQVKTKIRQGETGGELTQRLAMLGASTLEDTISNYVSGNITPEAQPEEGVTYAPLLKKSDGRLDFTKSAVQLERQIRAYEPWPSSFFFWGDLRIVARQAHVIDDSGNSSPGTATADDKIPAVHTGDGLLVFDRLQPAGKRTIRGDEFLRGASTFPGSKLRAG
jgi:methionyl-tRNA formyltransferase